ncbi:MAG: nicotinate (nicotinamide) nucleotide adenylyltransferase [Eubacteriaceae bacterium]|nr:nicotinate (nicotinamide) nucleotide adenylyltransferase [Eubacteriaceae bacterium]
MKIGIFGGSFNPIHNGHLQLCNYAKTALDIDRLILIPTGDNPIKGKLAVPREDRLNMTRLAAAEGGWEVSEIEIARPGVSYTIDTINELKKTLPGDYYFITGSDILFQLRKWKRIEELVKQTRFAIAARRGVDNSLMLREAEELNAKLGMGIILLEDYLIEEISSTKIRELIAAGESWEKFLPPAVAEYIWERGLYL